MDLARDLWTRLEAVHAVTYFAPRSHEAWAAAGIRGFWRGYFATRSAPLGPVPAPVVTAAFYGFHPAMVARAVPGVWEVVTPEAAWAARRDGSVAALDEVLGPAGPDEEEAAGLARRAAEAATGEGRALFAATSALPWPEGVRAQLWHAATLLREHRGDGHLGALVAADVDGCEALVLAAATGATPRAATQPHRGWSDDEWDAAVGRLAARGLVDPDDGTATDAGRALRDEVEAVTDRVALRPYAALGDDATRLRDLLTEPARRIAASGVIPVPNPMGLRP